MRLIGIPAFITNLSCDVDEKAYTLSQDLRFQAPQSGDYQLRLMDQSARVLEQYAAHFERGEQQIEALFQLAGLPAGAYLFQLVSPDGTAWLRQVVKQ